MGNYEKLTEISRHLHAEREALIDRRNRIKNMLELINNRLDELDEQIEGNLLIQEMYWPNFDKPTETFFSNNIIKEFYANPDLTAAQLAEKLDISYNKASRLLDIHFKSLPYGKA